MKTVLAHGVFDVLHIGHLAYLEAAKKFGDRLIVSVTADKYVNKGPGRPHFNQDQRMKMLRSFSCVDLVVLSDAPTALNVIREWQPNFYAKGPDYRNREDDPTGMIYAEEQAVKEYGGQIVFTDTPQFSSSRLINAEMRELSDAQKDCLEQVRAAGGMTEIKRILDAVAKLKVTVAGECIWDIYRYVTPQGLSSKSPSLSVRYEDEQAMLGGAWAIAAHCREFCETAQVKSGVEHKKIRYISKESGQRLFEVCEHPPERDTGDIRAETLIVADFGHGFWSGAWAGNTTANWAAVNVQTNSSNFGFNRIGRPRHEWDYLVCDLRELQLTAGSRELAVSDIVAKLGSQYCFPIAVTLGSRGAQHYIDDGAYTWAPAFADSVIDATGAGDAYFALTALLVRVDADPVLIPFLGNIFAGLKTRIVGNASAVSKASLLKACAALLA